MNLEQLEYIVQVAKTGSFTKAAEQSHVTLSAISQSISLLESEWGVSLFHRSRGLGAVPTPEGRALIAKANEALVALHDLRAEAQSYSDALSGQLRIATIPGPMHLLVHVVSGFKRDYPGVKVEIMEKGPKEILELLKHEKIDIGLIALSESLLHQQRGLAFERLLEGKMVVGVNEQSPLRLESAITPDKLAKQTFVLYDDEHIRDFMNQFVAAYGEVDVLFISNNTQAIYNAVKEGIAVTIGLDYSFKEDGEHIITLPLEAPATEPVYYGWVHPEEKHIARSAKRFLNRLQAEL
ncbi:LysR family transcriptional regulator [Paenibacillus dendritiformis]|uniref:LysR family transcriptional regulator n=1 Tax=Paenibacillus dendritiformis TaxID=130049 RepID=UPI000DA7D829|nr:LysR family transcriptional regulator [Paenibacillus dendritiformis]PZM63569.1 LysR family transcriptional regulator [Paenibacillus dendritiformis]